MYSQRTKDRFRTFLIIGALAVLLLISGSALLAQDGFSIPWWTADGGGGASAGENFTITGTIGQPDAGAPLAGSDYQLSGGFWPGETDDAPPAHHLYLPVVRQP